jgi:DNA-dependent RNA polymerase auxiliary subunit epsilon
LVAELEMPKNCFYQPDNKESKKDVLNTVFQIWERKDTKRAKIKVPDNGLIKKINPVDGKITGANFQIIAFGHSCGKCSDITTNVVDYKTTTMYLYVEKQEVKDALKNLDLSDYFNNVSYVQALSIQEINYELNKVFGLSNFNFKEE